MNNNLLITMGCSIGKKYEVKTFAKEVPSSRKITSVQELSVKPSNFIIKNESNFNQVYRLGQIIGQGRYGEVRLCFLRETNEKRAVKIFKKESQISREITLNEISIMKLLDHPNIIRIYEYFETLNQIHVVMEYCAGGELFDLIVKKKTFSEEHASKIIYQLLLAVCYMHENQIVHRDLKPENILLQFPNDITSIKVIDFGFSSVDEFDFTEKIGTIFFMAPEVIEGSYTNLCDMWSIGIISYILLTGFPPFLGRETEVAKDIEKIEVNYESEIWEKISSEGKDFVQRLMCRENERLSAVQALNHAWISSKIKNQPEEFNRVLSNLTKFQYSSKFKQAICTYLVTQCTQHKEIKDLTEIFHCLDQNSDGKLSEEEILQYYSTIYPIEEAKIIAGRVINNLDTDKNNHIDYFEFLAATVDQEKLLSENNIKKAFSVIDKDKNGKISINEIKEIVENGGEYDERLWREMLLILNEEEKDEIDFSEFLKILHTN